MNIIPKKLNQNHSAILRNENMIFGLNSQMDNTVKRLNELEKAIQQTKDLATVVKAKGDVNPQELVAMMI